jgi:hypothetical protein
MGMVDPAPESLSPESSKGPGENQFWHEVFPAELDAINRRVEVLNGQRGVDRPPVTRSEDRTTNAVGLALSGGGVRSAAFSLGVLQALNQQGVIDNIHYLSSVSGGGYAGGSMVAAMSVTGKFPFGQRPALGAPAASDISDTESVSHVRNYSNFLIPFGMRDVLTSVAIVLRGIVANAAYVLPVLLIGAAVTIYANPTVPDLTRPDILGKALPWLALPNFGVSIVLALAGLELFFLWAFFRSFLRQDERSEFRTYQRRVRSVWHAISGRLPGYAVIFLIVVAAVAFAEFQSFMLSAMFRAKANAPDTGSGVLGAVISSWIQWLAAVTAPIAAVVMFLRNQLAAILQHASGRSGIGMFLAGLATRVAIWIAGAALPLVLWVVYLYLTYWGIAFEPGRLMGPPACAPQELSGSIDLRAPGRNLSGDLSGRLTFDGALPCPSDGGGQSDEKPRMVLFPKLSHAPGLIQRLALVADEINGPIPPAALAYGGIALLLLGLAYPLKPNAHSLHRLYRDRLSKAFFFDPEKKAPAQAVMTGGRDFLPLDDMKLHEIATDVTPYPLINTTLNIQGSDIANRRGRNGDFFLFSPLFTGSLATCYAPTEALEELAPDLDFPTAIAVSGAAAAANMGAKSISALTPTLALLNVRLGYWLENPHYIARGTAKPAPVTRRVWVYLYNELTGRLYEDTDLVYLTDGGHIENLGIYELLRRKCRLIMVVDGEEDRAMRFHAFSTLQRYARIDLGIRISVPWQIVAETTREWMETDRKPEEQKRGRGPHIAVGRIEYGSGQEGYLIYLKLSLNGDENDYIRDYARRFPHFPHETTSDQFFSEEQFEVYRALGFHAMYGFLSGRDEIAVAHSILADARARNAGAPVTDAPEASEEGPPESSMVRVDHPALDEIRNMLGI